MGVWNGMVPGPGGQAGVYQQALERANCGVCPQGPLVPRSGHLAATKPQVLREPRGGFQGASPRAPCMGPHVGRGPQGAWEGAAVVRGLLGESARPNLGCHRLS